MQTALRFGRSDTLEAMKSFATPHQLLLLACNTGNREEARAIVANNPGIVSNLDEDDARELTEAASRSDVAAVELMLELGFDPLRTSTSGPHGTALHCAAWEGSPECVSALLAYPSGRALIDAKDPTYGGTPLDWCHHGSQSCRRPGADHAAVKRLLLALPRGHSDAH
jgi:hypothetical protein